MVLDHFWTDHALGRCAVVLFGSDAGMSGFPPSRDSQELHHGGALPRSGQVAALYDVLLYLRRLCAIFFDLVRQYSGRDHLVSPPHGGELAGDQSGDALPAFYYSVFDPTVPAREAQPEGDRLRCGVEPGGGIYRFILDRHADLLQDRTAAALAGSGDNGDHGQYLRPGFLEPLPRA